MTPEKDIVIVECTGLYAEAWTGILSDLADLWTGNTATPAGELFPVLIASILDQRSN